MTHTEYREMLSALLDGELSEAETGEALAHLETCAACRQYFAELTALHEALGEPDECGVPADFADGVLARLREGAAPKRRAVRRRSWQRTAALAACAAVVILAAARLPRMGAGKSAEAPAAPAAMPASVGESASVEGPEPALAAPAAVPAPAAPEPVPAPDAYDTEAYDTYDETAETAAGAGANSGQFTLRAPGNETLKSAVSGKEPAATVGSTAPEESGESAPAAGMEGDIPTVTLRGENAEAWLAENGWQGESGDWYADAAALRALPDGLETDDGALAADFDGAVRVELALEPAEEVTP